MKKILLFLFTIIALTSSAQIINTFQDSTQFKKGARFNSTVRIPTGAASGKVFTSDATGRGTWQPATGGSGTDSASYHTITSLNDSMFTINRPDGTQDTILLSGGGSGGGAGYAGNGMTESDDSLHLGGTVDRNTFITFNPSMYGIVFGTFGGRSIIFGPDGIGSGAAMTAIADSGIFLSNYPHGVSGEYQTLALNQASGSHLQDILPSGQSTGFHANHISGQPHNANMYTADSNNLDVSRIGVQFDRLDGIIGNPTLEDPLTMPQSGWFVHRNYIQMFWEVLGGSQAITARRNFHVDSTGWKFMQNGYTKTSIDSNGVLRFHDWIPSNERMVKTTTTGRLSQGVEISTIPEISTGAIAPASTPNKVGDIYIDTSAKKLYFATGTSSSADWELAN